MPSPVIGLVLFGVGGFLLVFGRFLLTVGFGGAAARYAAGEVAPAIKDIADHLKDPAQKCASCGHALDASSKFCNECGAPTS